MIKIRRFSGPLAGLPHLNAEGGFRTLADGQVVGCSLVQHCLAVVQGIIQLNTARACSKVFQLKLTEEGGIPVCLVEGGFNREIADMRE